MIVWAKPNHFFFLKIKQHLFQYFYFKIEQLSSDIMSYFVVRSQKQQLGVWLLSLRKTGELSL